MLLKFININLKIIKGIFMEFIEITLDNILEATDAQMEIFGPKDCAYLSYLQHIQKQ